MRLYTIITITMEELIGGKHKSVFAMGVAALAFAGGGFVWALAALGARGSGGVAAGPYILHFNDISGITQIGSVGDLARAGIFAGVAVIASFAVAFELDRRDRVLGKLMAAVTLAAAVLLFIACAAILNVN